MVFFFLLAIRYLVATGKGSGEKAEILDLSDPTMSSTKSCLSEDISYRYGSAGGMLGTIPVICGGKDANANFLKKCLLYGKSQTITMDSKRYYPSSVALNNSMIWILGGYNGARLSSTEFISIKNGAVIGPSLPEALDGSCAVKFDKSEYVYLVGGYNSSGFTNNVWVVNTSNGFNFTKGPSLNATRAYHGCSEMSIGERNVIVVAGGTPDAGSLASVEILDPLSNQWVAGN